MRASGIVAVACLAGLIGACGSEGADNPCTVGLTVSCPCLGGSQGVQVCMPGGAFGACTCPDANPSDIAADQAQPPADAPDGGMPMDVTAVDVGPMDATTDADVGADVAPDDGLAPDVAVSDVTADSPTDAGRSAGRDARRARGRRHDGRRRERRGGP
jgi:hypothetical protein